MWRVVEGEVSSPAEQRNLHPATPRSSEHKESSHNVLKRYPYLISDVAANSVEEIANSVNFKRSEVKIFDLDPLKTTEINNSCSNIKCNQFENLEKYVDLVNSLSTVNYPKYLKEVHHAYVVDDYNIHLKEAKDHVSMWRSSNIKNDIRRTYESAKLFGREFQRKYDICQKKLEMFRISYPDMKKKDNLLKDIKKIKGILQSSPSEDIVSYLEEKLLKKEKELNEFSVAERDLDECITFLEFVKKDANIIKERANVTGENIKHFRDLILKDQSSFNQSKTNAKQAIDTSLNDLKSFKDQIEKYKKTKETEEENYQHLAEVITKREATIDDHVKERTDNLQKYIENINAKPSYINVDLQWFFGSVKYSIGENTDIIKQNIEVMHNQQKVFEEDISLYKERAKLDQGKLDQTTQRIYNLEDKILKVSTDIKNLVFVTYYLESVNKESERILPYINKLLKNLNVLERISDNVVFRLENLIAKAKEVKGPVEKAQFEDLLYIDISTMQTDWNNAYSDIVRAESYVDADYYQETQPEE